MATIALEQVQANIQSVREHLAQAAAVSGRSANDVSLLAATKYVGAEIVDMLVRSGIDGIAENRLDALEQKQELLPGIDRSRWHYIGRLQSRKAAEIADRVGMVHSLCSSSAAQRIARWMESTGGDRPLDILLQVNVADDPGKDGLEVGEIDRFVAELPDSIVIHGLMTMPEFAASGEQSRAAFSTLRELRSTLHERYAGRHPFRHLSMGTSQDWIVAVEEGATHVRLGRVLYA